MSHIVKGTVSVAYVSKEHLIKAISGLGQLSENEKLYRVGVGYTRERYDLVLISNEDPKLRIGYHLNNGVWEQYQEDYGDYGTWTKNISSQVQDRYIAYHYEAQLKEEGFKVTIQQQNDGTLELLAEESAW
ncbi:hypothetical protein [Rheinheimera hassiensis]|uniref:hypothetical protein n=1 Tax=Rheinheimera hassiensis TaxID=1193627 RepID=UPI001F05E52F|nr:hypothetical protein [Rheinheimera hassiensis]